MLCYDAFDSFLMMTFQQINIIIKEKKSKKNEDWETEGSPDEKIMMSCTGYDLKMCRETLREFDGLRDPAIEYLYTLRQFDEETYQLEQKRLLEQESNENSNKELGKLDFYSQPNLSNHSQPAFSNSNQPTHSNVKESVSKSPNMNHPIPQKSKQEIEDEIENLNTEIELLTEEIQNAPTEVNLQVMMDLQNDMTNLLNQKKQIENSSPNVNESSKHKDDYLDEDMLLALQLQDEEERRMNFKKQEKSTSSQSPSQNGQTSKIKKKTKKNQETIGASPPQSTVSVVNPKHRSSEDSKKKASKRQTDLKNKDSTHNQVPNQNTGPQRAALEQALKKVKKGQSLSNKERKLISNHEKQTSENEKREPKKKDVEQSDDSDFEDLGSIQV